jgi:phosphatidylserine/phosphatidylglycerophosphate/cardiolipin synthase-like enzyme
VQDESPTTSQSIQGRGNGSLWKIIRIWDPYSQLRLGRGQAGYKSHHITGADCSVSHLAGPPHHLRAGDSIDTSLPARASLRQRRSWPLWTGPAPYGNTLRRADQVLLDLIRTAERTLYVVTFAAYKVPLLRAAMLEAARRGVEVTLIFESPESSAGKTAFGGLEALGEEMRDLAKVYVWPLEKRPKDAAGHHGSLHAKCAVADRASLLVSSANLTEFALNINMELGLLVRGGNLPGRVVDHIHHLMQNGVLIPLHQPLR